MKLLFCLSLLLVFSCINKKINWDPDFYVADSAHIGIVNETGIFISAMDPKFDGYACLSQDKVEELATILQKARMPNRDKEVLFDQLTKSIWWVKK